MTKKRFPFSRRAFLVQGLALLTGCRSLPNLPPLPFHDKEEDGENAPLLNVGGEVAEIRTTHDWRFMAVRSRTRHDDVPDLGAPVSGTSSCRVRLRTAMKRQLCVVLISLTSPPTFRRGAFSPSSSLS